MALSKTKLANRKWKHDHKRRQKAFAEKRRVAQGIEKRGRERNEKRRQQAEYVHGLEAELMR